MRTQLSLLLIFTCFLGFSQNIEENQRYDAVRKTFPYSLWSFALTGGYNIFPRRLNSWDVGFFFKKNVLRGRNLKWHYELGGKYGVLEHTYGVYHPGSEVDPSSAYIYYNEVDHYINYSYIQIHGGMSYEQFRYGKFNIEPGLFITNEIPLHIKRHGTTINVDYDSTGVVYSYTPFSYDHDLKQHSVIFEITPFVNLNFQINTEWQLFLRVATEFYVWPYFTYRSTGGQFGIRRTFYKYI